MELSLMYTKARVIHTLYGLCIRLVIVATVILMFLFINRQSGCGYHLHLVVWGLPPGDNLRVRRHGHATICTRLDRNGAGSILYSYLRWLAMAGSQRCRSDTKFTAELYGGNTEHMYALNKNRELPVLEVDLHTRIIIWFIATHFILESISEQDDGNCQEREAIKTVSHYMVVLLMSYPKMRPGHTRLITPLETYKNFECLTHNTNTTSIKDMLEKTCELEFKYDTSESTYKRGAKLAAEVLDKGWHTRQLLQEMFGVWVEMLCYTGSHCSRDSHARRLSSGSEFLTVVWLLTRHLAGYESLKLDINHRRESDQQAMIEDASSSGKEDGHRQQGV